MISIVSILFVASCAIDLTPLDARSAEIDAEDAERLPFLELFKSVALSLLSSKVLGAPLTFDFEGARLSSCDVAIGFMVVVDTDGFIS